LGERALVSVRVPLEWGLVVAEQGVGVA